MKKQGISVLIIFSALLIMLGIFNLAIAQSNNGYCEGVTSLEWSVTVRGTPENPGSSTRYTVSDPTGLNAFLSWNTSQNAWYADANGRGHLVGLTDEQYLDGRWRVITGYDASGSRLCMTMIRLVEATPDLMYPAHFSDARLRERGDLHNHPDYGWYINDAALLDQLTEYADIEVLFP